MLVFDGASPFTSYSYCNGTPLPLRAELRVMYPEWRSRLQYDAPTTTLEYAIEPIGYLVLNVHGALRGLMRGRGGPAIGGSSSGMPA